MVGEGLSVKVNANIGTSSDRAVLDEELEKLKASIDAGADSVMDLSTGGDMDAVWRSARKGTFVQNSTKGDARKGTFVQNMHHQFTFCTNVPLVLLQLF